MSYNLEHRLRIVVALAGFLGVIFFPWWVPLICMALLSVRFSAWEVPLIGLFVDLMWLPGGMLIPFFTLAGLMMMWLFEPLRRQFLIQ